MVLGGLGVAVSRDSGFTLLLSVQNTEHQHHRVAGAESNYRLSEMLSYVHSTSQNQHIFQSDSIVGSIVDPAYYPAACILPACSDTDNNNNTQRLSLLPFVCSELNTPLIAFPSLPPCLITQQRSSSLPLFLSDFLFVLAVGFNPHPCFLKLRHSCCSDCNWREKIMRDLCLSCSRTNRPHNVVTVLSSRGTGKALYKSL